MEQTTTVQDATETWGSYHCKSWIALKTSYAIHPSTTSSGLLALMAELTCCLNLLISSVGITVCSGSCEGEDRRGLFHEMVIGKVLDGRDIYCIVLNT